MEFNPKYGYLEIGGYNLTLKKKIGHSVEGCRKVNADREKQSMHGH